MPRGGLLAEIRNPAQLVVGAFTAFILIGTGLLWLPISADGPGHIGLEDALFTSTSAATVTGLCLLPHACRCPQPPPLGTVG